MDADTLRDLFAAFGPISVRRMFGGAGIYRDGVMFALVADGAIYLKADAESCAAFRSAGCGPFVYDGARGPVTMSYWEMPQALYDDPDALATWARTALAVAMRATQDKARKRKR